MTRNGCHTSGACDLPPREPGARQFEGIPIICRSDGRLSDPGCRGCREPWDTAYLLAHGLIAGEEEARLALEAVESEAAKGRKMPVPGETRAYAVPEFLRRGNPLHLVPTNAHAPRCGGGK